MIDYHIGLTVNLIDTIHNTRIGLEAMHSKFVSQIKMGIVIEACNHFQFSVLRMSLIFFPYSFNETSINMRTDIIKAIIPIRHVHSRIKLCLQRTIR